MTTSAWVQDVSEAEFERVVLQASRQHPVVVDFWAEWCQPCLMLAPVLERLVNERKGEVTLAKVNVEESPWLARQFAIDALPSVKAFRDGRVFREFVGVLPEAQLRVFLDEICPTEADRLVADAHGLEATQPAQAEQLYRQALAQQRNLDAARVGLARALLAQGRFEDMEEVLEPVGTEGPLGEEATRLGAVAYLQRVGRPLGDEATARQRLSLNPEDAAARFDLGCVLAAAGDYPAALEMLLSAGERDPKLAAGKVREAMVKVFQALGVNHPLASEYRGKLSRLLY
jgi:putative thioredoxin